MKRYRFVTLFVILGLLLSTGPAVKLSALRITDAPPAESPEEILAEEATIPSSPLMFIENLGQFDEHARFQVRSGNSTLWLAEDALWITIPEQTNEEAAERGREAPLHSSASASKVRKGVNLRLSFPGANPHPRLEGLDRLETTVNYFVGNNPGRWRSHVPVWGGVRYVDLYPGVDLEISGAGGQWTWKFAVRNLQFVLPDVRLQVGGAEDLSLDGTGRLQIATALGDFTLPLPTLTVADFRSPADLASLNHPILTGFEVFRPFAPIRPQVAHETPSNQPISPHDASDLRYATFLGGSDSDFGRAIAVDGTGAVYVTGDTLSSDFPTTPGVYDRSYNGGDFFTGDAFVSKLAPDGGNLLYSTFLGGSSTDCGYAIAVDDAGMVYVAGKTSSPNFPTTPGSYDTSLNNYSLDAFVSKLAPDGGSLLYSTFLGGRYSDSSRAIAVDGAGAAYVTGSAGWSDFPTTSGAYDTSYSGGEDVFVSKLAPDGSSLRYSTFLGGSDRDYGYAVAVDGAGAVYVTGMTKSSDFPTTLGAYDSSYNGGSDHIYSGDVFVSKMVPDGSSLHYSTFLGGRDSDFGHAIVVDGTGEACVTGSTDSSDFPTTLGAYDTDCGTDGNCDYDGTYRYGDVFVSKLAPDGSRLRYSTFLGGSSTEYGRAIAVDKTGLVYIAGDTGSSDFPTTPPWAYDVSFNGGYIDAFVSKLALGGSSLRYSTFLGGSGSEQGTVIAVDGAGAAYVTGLTDSSDFPTTPGAYDTSYNGGYSDYNSGDAFVVKLLMGGIVVEARADIGMPHSIYRGCLSPYTGCGGPYHGFYYGVCTDLVLDAYNAGVPFNLQDALLQDHLAHPGWYRYGTARYPEDMRCYFHHNQQLLPHSQAYQPGDVAFFDWNGDGLSDHVGVISEIDADGRPLRMVHASGVCSVNPSGRAFEQGWNSHYDQHIQGHGRLSETASVMASADETLQLLRITIDSPSVALRLHDANGKSTSDTYDENLVASGIEASIPYIPGGWYADLGTERVITVTWPLSNTSQYFVEVTGEAAVTYHLRIETLQDASVTDSEVFTQAIAAGETHGGAITLSAPGGTIEFSAISPAPAPLPGVPESLTLSGLVGTSAQATFTITETGGQQPLQNVAISATDLMDSLGGMVSGSLPVISPDDFTVSAGGSQQADVQVDLAGVTPGAYRGALVVRSNNAGTQMIPLSLAIQFHQVYLPTVLKSY